MSTIPFTVRTPTPRFSGTVAGVIFQDGVGETSDPRALAYFHRHGYTVEQPTPEAPPFPAGDPVEAWKVDELRAWAKANNITLGEAKNKPDILAAIAAAGTPPQG